MFKCQICCNWWIRFIGSNLIEYLLSQGHNVINIDKISYSSNFFNVEDFNKNKRYKFFLNKHFNKKKLTKIIQNLNLIINVAAKLMWTDQSIIQMNLLKQIF